jgi:hypothetical protein
MNQKIFAVILASIVLLSSFGVPISTAEEEKSIGILVIAHGSPREDWCRPVREAVENVNLPYPVELGFLEFVPNETIDRAVDKLDEKYVKEIIAVPLFISSYSSHISEIEYVLGLRETWPGEEEPLEQVDTPAEIVLTNAIDDHSFIAQILVDRAAELCENPEDETVVIVAHGTDNETNFAGWVNSSESLAGEVKLMLRHSKGLNIENVRYSFLFANSTLHPDLMARAVVEDVSTTSYPIVVPLMTSEGFFTDTYIPNMLLEDLDFAYAQNSTSECKVFIHPLPEF